MERIRQSVEQDIKTRRRLADKSRWFRFRFAVEHKAYYWQAKFGDWWRKR